MKQITLDSGVYLLVEVPEGISDIQLHKVGGLEEYLITYFIPNLGTEKVYLPKPGQWKIVGLAKKMTNEKWMKIVHYEEVVGLRIRGWEDYAGKFVEAGSEYHLNTATESGLSLIKSRSMKPETTLILKQITQPNTIT